MSVTVIDNKLLQSVDRQPETAALLPPSEQVCVQLPTYADNVAPPAFAAVGAAIDRYRLPAGPTAANLQQSVVHAWTDRQTDRRTDTVLFHRACCACYASSDKNIVGG